MQQTASDRADEKWTARAMPESDSFKCPNCGSNKFVLPKHATNETPVVCKGCGKAVARWGDFRTGLLEDVKEKSSPRTKAHKATGGR